MDPLYTTHDISRLLQVDPSTVSKWIDRGLLEAFKTPGGHRRVRAPNLREFLTSHGMPLPPELAGTAASPRIRALLVNGGKGAVEALRKVLRARNGEVVHVESAIQALVELGAANPTHLFWDADAACVDAAEAIRTLTTRPGGNRLTVYALLSKRTAGLEQKLRKAGVSQILVKPLTTDALSSLFGS